MNRDMTEPKVVIERSHEDQRTTNIGEMQTGHIEDRHVCPTCGSDLSHQDTQSRDTHHAVSAQDQPCSQETQSVSSEETQSVSSEETQSEHSVLSEETQGLGECGGTTISGTENVQLGSHSHIYHGTVHHAPVHHAPVHHVYNFTINCSDSDPRSLQKLTEAVREALGTSDHINSPVQQPHPVAGETTLRQIQASPGSPVQQPHPVEAETTLRKIQASSASSSTPETSAQSSRHERQPRRSENSPVQQPHPASSAAPETSAQSSRHERQPRRSQTGEMGDREDVAIVDMYGQTILPGDAVFCEGHRFCLYIGGLELVWCQSNGLVRRGQLDLTQTFMKQPVISGRCQVFSPQERVTRAVEKVGSRMTERELEPKRGLWWSRAFLAWLFTGLSEIQAEIRGFDFK